MSFVTVDRFSPRVIQAVSRIVHTVLVLASTNSISADIFRVQLPTNCRYVVRTTIVLVLVKLM